MPAAGAFDSGHAEIERPFPSAKHCGCDLSPLFATCNPLWAYRSTAAGMLISMVNAAGLCDCFSSPRLALGPSSPNFRLSQRYATRLTK